MVVVGVAVVAVVAIVAVVAVVAVVAMRVRMIPKSDLGCGYIQSRAPLHGTINLTWHPSTAPWHGL